MTALTSFSDTTSAAADTSVLPTPFKNLNRVCSLGNETDIGHTGGACEKLHKNEPCQVSYSANDGASPNNAIENAVEIWHPNHDMGEDRAGDQSRETMICGAIVNTTAPSLKVQSPLTTFTCFYKLPIEVRLMTWGLAFARTYIYIPYITKVRRYPCPQTPAREHGQTACRESLLDKKYVLIWKYLNTTRPDRGKRRYAWVDPKDTLYLDTGLDIRGDVEDFQIEFDSVVLSQIGFSPLELHTLLQWIISLCHWEEGRPVSPGPKEIRLVQKSYELETIAGRVNSENDLLLVDLDKSHDISWISRLAPVLDGEIAKQQNKTYVLSGYDDNEVRVEQTAVGEHVLHFGRADEVNFSIKLPPAATVKYYSDAEWDLSCWDINLSCWDTLSVLLSEIGQKYLEYLGFEGQTPTFRRLVQFRSTENDEKFTDEHNASIDSSLDSD